MVEKTTKSSTASVKPMNPLKSFGKEVKRNRILFLMLLPTVIYVIIFSYVPMAGIIIAFKDYRFDLGMFGSQWVGFKNFSYFYSSGKMWELTRNTLSYNLLFLVVGVITKIFTAVVISEMCTKYYKRFLQSLMMLPRFLSWVIIGSLVYNILNYEFGTLNTILKSLGIAPVDVYNNPKAWKPIFTFITVWQSTGYGMIFYLAAITGINTEIYEAAYIDGAGLLKRIWHVTIPLIMPTTIILLLLSLGGILKGNMDMFYQIIGNNSKLFSETDVIDTYVFRTLTQIRDFTVTSAAGLYQQVIGCILVLLSNAIVRKVEPDSALF